MIFAMLIKETRENLRWAGLIALVTAGLLAVGLYDQFSMGMSIAGRTFLNVCLFMYPAAGLAMGMLQIFQDARKGRWQFMSHRPMSLRWMLACKILVGIVLYFAATLLPLMVATLWVSVPGHVPGPFSWDMVEQPIADVFIGIIWYAGGLFIAGRKARWIGSRIIPLGASFAASLGCYILSWTLWEWIALSIVFAGIILIGLLGIYGTENQTDTAPRWAKPSILLSLLAGWCCVLAMAMPLGDGIFRWFKPAPWQNQPYQTYHLGGDGTLHLSTWQGGELLKDEDLNGKLFAIPKSNWWADDLEITTTLYFDNPDTKPRRIPWGHGSFFDPEQHLIRLQSAGNWFYIPRRRTVESYNQQNCRFNGSIGADGFASASVKPKPFPGPMNYTNRVNEEALFTRDDAVYAVDLSHNSIDRIFTATPNDPVLTASSTEYSLEGRLAARQPTYTVVATRSSLHFLQQNKPPVTVPIENVRANTSITVARTVNGQYVVAYGMNYPVGDLPVSIWIYDGAGHAISHSQMAAGKLNEFDPGITFEAVGALLLSPPAFFALIFAMRGEPQWMQTGGIILCGSLFFTAIVIAMLRARHATRRQMFFWIPMALLLGLVAIPLLMSMLQKPRSVRCGGCGKRRLISEDSCPNCATPVEVPPMEGIEIFAMTV